MIIVADKLAQIAVNEHEIANVDSFGRSAFNRYYYASYLITRNMLQQIAPQWACTGHKEIPKLLEGALISKIRRELLRQKKLGLMRGNESAILKSTASTAVADLSSMLKAAYGVRCVADYEPSQKISRNGRVIKLVDNTTEAARRWSERASCLTNTIIRIWRQLGLS